MHARTGEDYKQEDENDDEEANVGGGRDQIVESPAAAVEQAAEEPEEEKKGLTRSLSDDPETERDCAICLDPLSERGAVANLLAKRAEKVAAQNSRVQGSL